MQITENNLLNIMPNARSQAGVFVSVLNVAMLRYQIIGPKRMAAFIAQIGHESGQLQYVRELGSNQYLSKYDTGTLAARLGNTPALDGDGHRTALSVKLTFNYRDVTSGKHLEQNVELKPGDTVVVP